MVYSNSFVKVDLDAILENFRQIRLRAGTDVMAVVKANAYGHGAVPVAKVLEPEAAFFGVSSVAEALQLRNAGIQRPILILGPVPAETYEELVKRQIRPAIFTVADAEALSRAAQKLQMTAYFHFALDTGMSRIGFQVTEEAAEECAKITTLPGIKAEGLFSHFATADETDLTRTRQQAEQFATFDRMLKDRGVKIPLRHLDNSAGIMNFGCHYEMVRAGIVLYGLYPSEEVNKKLLILQPAMSWHSCISHIKTLEPDRQISYGGTFTVSKPMRVATVPVGYADGYRRSMSGKFYVLIRGTRAPILGRICMDQFMVDVTHLPDVQPGEPVVLMGKDGGEEISAEALGAAASGFNYEQVCDIGYRVTRVYYKDGKTIEKENYLL